MTRSREWWGKGKRKGGKRGEEREGVGGSKKGWGEEERAIIIYGL